MVALAIVIPTFNSGWILDRCLASIKSQSAVDDLCVYIVDGGSSDNTISIAKTYDCKIIINKKGNHPAGRALALQQISEPFVCWLDSDNILPVDDWVQKMLEPFNAKEVVIVEPSFYEFSTHDPNLISSYCAIIGGDDPIVVELGLHDRDSLLAPNIFQKSSNSPALQKYYLDDLTTFPSLGANGTIVRRKKLGKKFELNVFHVDMAHSLLDAGGVLCRVQVGVIHWQTNSLWRFLKKKFRRGLRRVDRRRDMGFKLTYKKYDLFRIIVKLATFFPVIVDALTMYIRSKKGASLLHPVMIYAHFFIYVASSTIGWLLIKKDHDYEKYN